MISKQKNQIIFFYKLSEIRFLSWLSKAKHFCTLRGTYHFAWLSHFARGHRHFVSCRACLRFILCSRNVSLKILYLAGKPRSIWCLVESARKLFNHLSQLWILHRFESLGVFGLWVFDHQSHHEWLKKAHNRRGGKHAGFQPFCFFISRSQVRVKWWMCQLIAQNFCKLLRTLDLSKQVAIVGNQIEPLHHYEATQAFANAHLLNSVWNEVKRRDVRLLQF